MKQNIIIVLLTAICGLLGWVGAQVYEERQAKAHVATAQSVQEVKEKIAQTSEQLNRAVVEADLAVQDIKETAGLPTDDVVNGGIHNLKNKFTYEIEPDSSKKGKPFEKGTFQVLAVVDKSGKVIDVSVINPSTEELVNDMTITQIKNLSIPPKIINGNPSKTRYLIPVHYEAYY